MKILTFEETSIIINRFEEIKNKEVHDKIMNSKSIYKNSFDVGFGDCFIEIYDCEGYLYIRTVMDDVDSLEPLLIQVEDDGTIVDFVLLDFVLRFKQLIDLDKYYVLQTDYSFIMDRVRFIK